MRAGRGRSPQMAMSAEDAVVILDGLEGAGLRAWVDGGWAIDAVAGRQTRPHDDLDLV
ncbi:MAG: nucleotidyltransferase domain-containing protein, partial [Gaiellaceae bacterium]